MLSRRNDSTGESFVYEFYDFKFCRNEIQDMIRDSSRSYTLNTISVPQEKMVLSLSPVACVFADNHLLQSIFRQLSSLEFILNACCVCRRWYLASVRPSLRSNADLSGTRSHLVRDHEVLWMLRRHARYISDIDLSGCK